MFEKFTKVFAILYVAVMAMMLAGCDRHTAAWERMDVAESLMESRPDSALLILDDIDHNNLGGKEETARYALLKSMAIDKNYIDTTTFEVLQPAIDYYPKKGTPDEKLRTYYYQGRIYENQGDKDNAINTFAKALDNTQGVNDSLCLGRALVAQAYLYYGFYDFQAYLDNNLKAAKIYQKYKYRHYEFDCLLNALNGANLLNNKPLADSLVNLLNTFESLNEEQRHRLHRYKLSYITKLGTKEELADFLNAPNAEINNDIEGLLNRALAYHKLGENEQAKRYLASVYESGEKFDTLKYLAILVPVFENMGEYKEALSTYYDFSHKIDSINSIRLEQKSKSIEDKHALELKAQKDAQQKDKIIWGCIGGIATLALVVIILILLVRSHKTKKKLALQKAKAAEFEREKLRSEKENLALENRNLQLERDKKILEAENLAHRVEILENESESLKNLMETPEEIPSEVQKAISVRIEMLNSLLAKEITNNDSYAKPYHKWIESIHKDKAKFMNSTREAFTASHPRFIDYLESHNLTEAEINYLCLYALGLRGKEVGEYIEMKRHYAVSSEIRKKLGIDEHETNIGIYVRRLLNEL